MYPFLWKGRPWTIPPKDQAFAALLENGRVVTWGNPRAGGGLVIGDVVVEGGMGWMVPGGTLPVGSSVVEFDLQGVITYNQSYPFIGVINPIYNW